MAREQSRGRAILKKVLLKGLPFSISIFMLLLTMGFGGGGRTGDPAGPGYERFAGQAKVAAPGARTSGFQSVASRDAPAPGVVEKSIFQKIREAADVWMGVENGQMVSATPPAKGSELQQLHRRRSTHAVPDGMTMRSLK